MVGIFFVLVMFWVVDVFLWGVDGNILCWEVIKIKFCDGGNLFIVLCFGNCFLVGCKLLLFFFLVFGISFDFFSEYFVSFFRILLGIVCFFNFVCRVWWIECFLCIFICVVLFIDFVDSFFDLVKLLFNFNSDRFDFMGEDLFCWCF